MAALYQHVSDYIPGVNTPYSGVIRVADGRWIATQAVFQKDYNQFLDWFDPANPDTVPDPYMHPDHGGAVIVLQEGEVAVGSMLDSLPLEQGGNPPSGIPVNIDVPMISGTGAEGSVLNCTMGNWHGEPTWYGYTWVMDETAPVGASLPDYTVEDGLAGHSITCLVTASNDMGSTTALPSNAIAIVAAGGAAQAAPPARSVPRHAEKEEPETRHSRRREE